MRAIIWDMDGVIIDSEPYHFQSEIDILRQYGINITTEIAKEHLGLKAEDYFSKIAEKYNKNLPIVELLQKHYEYSVNTVSSVVPLNPNVIEVLTSLNDSYLQVLATSSPKVFTDAIINRFNLSPFFKLVITGEDIIAGKPDPEIFLDAASQLSVKPGECVVVEDSLNGFKAAKEAGMKLIAYKAGHNSEIDFSLADYKIEDLKQVINILQDL